MPSPKVSYSSKLYNVKILKTYVAYLKNHCGWTEDKVEKLFELCGCDVTLLDSDDHWYDQVLADLFQEKVRELTGDEEIAYKVGHDTFSAYAQGIQGKLLQGLMSPQMIYRYIGKYSASYSRGSVLEAVKVTSRSAILRSNVLEGCEEKPYQCQNRKGILEAIALSFGGGQASIVENKCFHQGGPYCEYAITWEIPARFPKIAAAALGAVLSTLVFYYGLRNPVYSLLAGLNVGLSVYFYLLHQTGQKLQRLVRDKNGALQESLRIFNRRYDENALKQKILSDIVQTSSLGDLCRSVADSIRNVMKYDRVMVMLADTERNVLKTEATAGFEGDLKELVETAEFHIDPDNIHGFFIRVLNTKEPLFLRDALRKMDELSPRSQRFLKLLGTKAFIAVPILTSSQAAGVLAVENTNEFRPLVNDDRDMLVEIAKFMGMVIPNVKNFRAIQESEKLAKVLEDQERRLRRIFQKFVPEEAVSRLSHFGSEFLPVQKRVVDVMFVDVMGFTSFSEACPPEEVADILSTYIGVVQETVKQYGGRINKIIGDGLLVYFDEPGPSSIQAGYAILQSRAEINTRLRAKGYEPIALGVGAHRGVCTIGYIGTDERLDYTLIGDTVNVASRIESYTRNIGPNTFCCSSTMMGDAKGFKTAHKGKVFLKGRKESIEILQVIKPQKKRTRNPIKSVPPEEPANLDGMALAKKF